MVFIFTAVCCVTFIMHTTLENNGRTIFQHKQINLLCFQESTVMMRILVDGLQGLVTLIFDMTPLK
jgi:hypothetical protein